MKREAQFPVRDPLARCSDCGRLTEKPVGAAIDVVRCTCGGRLIFPAEAYLTAVRRHSQYRVVRMLSLWLATVTVTMPAKKNPLLARIQQRALNDLPLFALAG